MLFTVLQVNSAVDILSDYMKEVDAAAGLIPEEPSIYYFYLPDMQYIFYVWIPEVSTTPWVAYWSNWTYTYLCVVLCVLYIHR